MRRRYDRIRVGLVASDVLCILTALIASRLVRYGATALAPGELAVVAIAPPLWVALFHAFNLYAPEHLSPAEEFRRTIGATGVGVVLLVMASYWTQAEFSRLWVGLTWMLAVLEELASRRAWRWREYRLRLDGCLAYRTLIVGTGDEAARLGEVLRAPGSGFAPVGYVQTLDRAPSTNSLPVLGAVEELARLVREYVADCLFVASTAISTDDVALVAQAARREGVEVRVSANLPQILASRVTLQEVGPVIALSLRPARLSGGQAVAKRAFDLAASSLLLLATLPLQLVIALAVKASSRGPVLFHQARVTKGGRVFGMHKFRTMRVGAGAGMDTSAPFFKLRSDPRLTRVGRVIRRLSLDELPQLWNVLLGEMSLVGPRPLPANQVAANHELLSSRQEVPAGMTGWWQINGRSRVTAEEALRLDLFYIENWSLTLDLYIVLKTLGAVLGGRGAY